MKLEKVQKFLLTVAVVFVLLVAVLVRFNPDLLPESLTEGIGQQVAGAAGQMQAMAPEAGAGDIVDTGQSSWDAGPIGTANSVLDVPAYTDSAWVAINDNIPEFTAEEITYALDNVFETYSELDALGRCGVAYANICQELMPTESRESISSVTPSGWNNQKYDSDLVEGGWIYNRCHLIGFQLAGENANPKNLITGTRYLNIDGMLSFENMIADYVKETDNHVLYRVTPVYDGNNLVASGLQLEGYSVEDRGEAICFNVYSYNVQPGIEIDYATGENHLAGG